MMIAPKHTHRPFSSFQLTNCLIALILLLAASGSASAQQFRNTIIGFVFGADRTPVTQVHVELSNEVNQILQRTRTDGTGRYFFGGLSQGRFYVRVLPYGTNYEEQTQEVEIISIVRPGGTSADQVFKDIYLRVRKGGPDVRSVSGTVFAQEIPAEAKKLYEKGVADLDGNRTDVGIQALMEALKLFPDYYLALERLGREYMRQANYEYARAVYLKMVSVNEKSFAGWQGLGYAAYGLKQSDVAVEAAKKATVLEPNSTEAFLLLGISYRQQKNFAESEKALLKAKTLAKGTSSDVHWNLALLYGNNMNKYREAADELELFLKVAPSDAKKDDVKKLIARFREKASAKS